jgi:hypothetical protein
MLWNLEVHVKFTCCTTLAIFVYNNMITCCIYDKNKHTNSKYVGNIVNTVKLFLQRILQQEPTVFNNVRIRRLCRPKHTIYIVLCFVILHISSHMNRGIIDCWLLLKNSLQKQLYRVHNVTDMECEIMDIWQTIPLHYSREFFNRSQQFSVMFASGDFANQNIPFILFCVL